MTGIIFGFIYFQVVELNPKAASLKNIDSKQNLKIFTLQELGRFNGTEPKLPIYLSLDGNIYDVTKGKEFYKVGGPYHYLAGKDSSIELHLVGGDIIKRKYPIVGKLSVINN